MSWMSVSFETADLQAGQQRGMAGGAAPRRNLLAAQVRKTLDAAVLTRDKSLGAARIVLDRHDLDRDPLGDRGHRGLETHKAHVDAVGLKGGEERRAGSEFDEVGLQPSWANRSSASAMKKRAPFIVGCQPIVTLILGHPVPSQAAEPATSARSESSSRARRRVILVPRCVNAPIELSRQVYWTTVG